MRNENGISIILADNEAEIDRLVRILGLTDVYPLSALAEMTVISTDTVFFAVQSDTAHLERLPNLLSVRRGVISVEGKRRHLGFNVDWMSRLLAEKDLDKAIEAVADIPVPKPAPKMTVIEGTFERDDPYESLGYRR